MSFERKIKRRAEQTAQKKDKKLEKLLFCPKCGGVLDYDVVECNEKALQVMLCNRCGYCAETDHDPYGTGEAYRELKEVLENKPTGNCTTCWKQKNCKGKVWPCNPDKATTCTKQNCFIGGGPCRSTHEQKYAVVGSASFCPYLYAREKEKGSKV